MRDTSSGSDIIDSRDVDERIEELTDLIDANYEADGEDSWDDERAELALLTKLKDDAASGEWKYGVALIRDSYFEDYARQTAEDMGSVSPDDTWPHDHIDWEAAASALRQGYTSVEYDEVTYWYHS